MATTTKDDGGGDDNDDHEDEGEEEEKDKDDAHAGVDASFGCSAQGSMTQTSKSLQRQWGFP